jgi:hypothetical protein
MPIGPDARRWGTRTDCAEVLVVVDTVTSGQRLMDAIALFEGDVRVQVVFTSPPGGVFDDGVAEILAAIGAKVVPWRRATEHRFSVALAAGHEGVHELRTPVILMPHGGGFTRRVPAGRHGRVVAAWETYGLGPQWLIRDGVLVPDSLVLAHADERARLRRACPQALPAAVVVGDPCYDKIIASLPRRHAYRDALGVAPGRRLAVVTMTWGATSLPRHVPEMLSRLVSELPPDEYQVVALAHANAWFGHGRWQVRAWLADALRGGLRLVPPGADWRGVVAAADVVVGDAGPVTLHATAAGVPVALGCRPSRDVDPESPLGELAGFAPRLSSHRPLAAQLRRLTPEFRREQYAGVASRITSEPGRFNRRMRDLMYRKLGLPAPQGDSPMEPARLPVFDG